MKTIADLTPDPNNPRRIPEEAAEGLAVSIESFGDISSITFNIRTGQLVCGHQRVSQIKRKYGDCPIEDGVIKTPAGDFPIRVVDWDAATQRAANIAANASTISGEFTEGLDEMLEQIAADNEDLFASLRLDDLAELEGIELGGAEPETDEGTEPQLDRAEELREQWGTETGQLWVIESTKWVQCPECQNVQLREQQKCKCGVELDETRHALAHRLLCGDSTKTGDVERLMDGVKADLCFTSPPYGQQRDYTAESKEKVQDWDGLMCGVFANLPMSEAGQVLVNLGLIHREGEWVPYWDGWIEWMREQGWRRFGWYVWDQGPGLPGNWNGRFAPSFEFVFHFNRQSIEPAKWVEKLEASIQYNDHGNGMRRKDGTMSGVTSPEKSLQPTKVPDSVIRVCRHKARGIECQTAAPMALGFPEYIMRSWTGAVYEPFCGSGTTTIAAEQLGRRCYGMEISPAYTAVILQRAKDAGCLPRLVEG